MIKKIKLSKKYLEFTRSEYPAKYIGRLIRFMGLKEDMRILDVGCGTGYITRYIAKALNSGEVYGIDIDKELLYLANEDNKHNKYQIIYSEQNAYNMEFEDEFFDIVLAHSFFGTIIDPQRAITEIGRVLKLGGELIAVEPTLNNFTHYPQFTEDIRKLIEKANDCYRIGIVKNGFNPYMAHCLPQLMINAGFKNIKSTGYVNIDLLSDYENKEKEINRYKYYYDNFDEINDVFYFYMLEGGLTKEELETYKSEMKKWIENLINNPDLLDSVGECTISNMVAFKAVKYF